ncbi:hypothetical protein V8G54_022515 [Vigna mungo]|uniref:ABC transporter domain-containing protein n=1 Tax=Vigna mungo TaxID=3915 RepID=A0AAQ3N2M2_VIGMU
MEIEAATAKEKGVAECGETMEVSEKRGMYLVWEDLTVVVPNFGDGHTKRLLNGLSGYAEPNKIMAIMGPSGSGKSTLLDALAGSFQLLSVHHWCVSAHKDKKAELNLDMENIAGTLKSE